VVSVQGRGLPAERGELACAGDHHRSGSLAAGAREVRPALVKAALAAPRDLHDTRVLTGLACLEAQAHRWLVTVVMGGLDQ
jgi:hypothetical protein